jgi:FkbM family methyltransferase
LTVDTLVYLHRRLQGVVGLFGLRRPAQKIFRYYYAKSYANDRLASAAQNGRTWLLHPEVALRGEFAEFETIEWLRQVIKPGDTVIDVGANVGQMTLEMAHLVGPTGRVIAVEPGPGNLRLLRRHVEANGFAGRVTIIEAACCEVHGGTVEFKIWGASADTVGSGHTLVLNGATGSPGEQQAFISRVRTASLDGLCADHGARPAVIKIDVEGAELRVLDGARQTLQANHPALRVGFHPFAFDDAQAATRSLLSLLDGCGYETSHLGGEDALQLNEYEFYANPAFASRS